MSEVKHRRKGGYRVRLSEDEVAYLYKLVAHHVVGRGPARDINRAIYDSIHFALGLGAYDYTPSDWEGRVDVSPRD